MDSYKYEYTHSPDGSETLYIKYIWNNTYGWLNQYKSEYTYDSGGNQIYFIRYAWNPNTAEWINDFKAETTYSNNDYSSDRIGYEWDTTTVQWVNANKIINIYDANENKILDEIYRWNNTTQQWNGEYKEEFMYNNTGYQTLHATYLSWDTTTSQWIGAYKTEMIYDTNENKIQNNNYRGNVVTGQWEFNNKYEYTYDNSYAYNDLIIPFSEEEFHHKRINFTHKFWNKDTQEWVIGRVGNYYYSELLTGINPAIVTGISIFPNPTDDLLNFDLKNNYSATAIIHDAQGKYIGTQDLQNNQLSVRHLDSGVYFYQLNYGGEMFGGKFIVK